MQCNICFIVLLVHRKVSHEKSAGHTDNEFPPHCEAFRKCNPPDGSWVRYEAQFPRQVIQLLSAATRRFPSTLLHLSGRVFPAPVRQLPVYLARFSVVNGAKVLLSDETSFVKYFIYVVACQKVRFKMHFESRAIKEMHARRISRKIYCIHNVRKKKEKYHIDSSSRNSFGESAFG